jgi:hypothetical protein
VFGVFKVLRERVVLLTIIGWCTFQWTESVTGNLGIISVFPIVTFYASGILVKSDYESLSWAVRILLDFLFCFSWVGFFLWTGFDADWWRCCNRCCCNGIEFVGYFVE